MSGEPVLAVEGVSKRFRRGEMYDSLRDLIPALAKGTGRTGSTSQRDFWALTDVSFEVSRGEAFGIIGSNGAGKSTILKLLSGIMRPTRGTITVRGNLSALIEVGAGFHPDLTGRENIYLNGTILGMSRKEIRRKFDQIVDFADLAEFIDTPVKRYSSGMYARLGFAVAAHVEPDVLIVDEVLSVGDYLFQQKCVDRMNEVIHSGATVIFVSHNLHAVSGLCRRSLLLEKGKVLACTSTDQVIRMYLERAGMQRPDESASVEISNVRVRSKSGASAQFSPGETAYVDFTIEARTDCGNITPVIQIVDDNFYPIFDTDTSRLSGDLATMKAGDRLESTIALTLHLGAGTYHVNVYAHQYIADHALSVRRCAATFFIGETRTVKGRANLYPDLVRYEHHHADERSPAPGTDGRLADETYRGEPVLVAASPAQDA